MSPSRRSFLGALGSATAATFLGTVPTARSSLAPSPDGRFEPRAPASVPVGICDWNLGPACRPDLIPRARKAHLEGIQVSVGTGPDRMPLRREAVRERYLELGEEHEISYPSVAAGSILNSIPLKSEPQSAVYVIDAVEAASALGAPNVLMAFFGAGDLRRRDEDGNPEDVSDGPHAEYRLDEEGVQRVVDALRQIAPRAEEAGVTLGLEDTLTAAQDLAIIEEVGSPALSVYYDTGNSAAYGYDVPGEIRMLGDDRICEIHLKDREADLLGTPGGEVDFEAVAEACRAIDYDGWYVLEESGREGRFRADTRSNVAFAKETFA